MKKFILLLVSTTVLSSTAIAENKMVFTSWGGSYAAAQKKGLIDPWVSATGNTVIIEDFNGSLAPVKSQVEAKNVTWDVVDLDLNDAITACDAGLLEEIDISTLAPASDGTPAIEDFFDNSATPCSVATGMSSHVFAYDTRRFPNGGPQSWADFWDVEKFPGKRGLRKRSIAALQFALIADGVDPNSVTSVLDTEAGLARAFAKLDELKPHIIWWTAGAQPAQLLADQEVSMSMAYHGRMFTAIEGENQPFQIVWDGHIYSFTQLVIPKGAPHKDQALDFLRWASSAEGMKSFAQHYSISPARRSALDPNLAYASDSSIKMIDYWPAAHMKNAGQRDVVWWSDHLEEIEDRFQTWLAQ